MSMYDSLEEAFSRIASKYHYDPGELELIKVQALCRIADHLAGDKSGGVSK